MINKIISFSINNKFIIGLFIVALVGTGIWSMATINLGSVPDITNNQVQVITVAPNLGTEDIEQFVTYPVELAMANLPDVIELRRLHLGLERLTVFPIEPRLGVKRIHLGDAAVHVEKYDALRPARRVGAQRIHGETTPKRSISAVLGESRQGHGPAGRHACGETGQQTFHHVARVPRHPGHRAAASPAAS